MKNIKAEQNGNILRIEIDLSKTFGPSSSGKTTIIATSEGNVELSDKVSNGSAGVYMGLNNLQKINLFFVPCLAQLASMNVLLLT